MDNPQLYLKANILLSVVSENVFNLYSPNIKWLPNGGDRIMDIGCGPGDFTADVFLPNFPPNIEKIVGTDISAPMIETASKTYANNSKLEFDIMDISEDLPKKYYEDFDHVVSAFTLHWAKNHTKALENVYDLLKPGGDTLFWFAGYSPLFYTYLEMAPEPRWRKYMNNVTDPISPYQWEKSPEEALRKNMEAVGFRVEICKLVTMKMPFPDEQSLKDFVESINPFVRNMPEGVKKEYLEELVKKLKTYVSAEDKGVPNMFYTYILVAYANKESL